jgi:UDP-glucose 4-epimerase
MVGNRILVTGCSGFIGSHMADHLVNNDWQVIGVDKKDSISDRYQFIKFDLQEDCSDLPDVDVVLHLAAANGTKWFYMTPYDVIKNTIMPTIRLLDRYKSVKKFIYAGTPESVSGATDLGFYPVPTDENCPIVISDITNARWSYAGSKALGEQAVIASGIPYTVIRYHNVFGPGQVDHFIPDFIEKVKQGVFELHGHLNTRTFMYIEDACEATSRLIATEKSTNQIVNIGNNRETTILEVAQFVLECLGYHDTTLQFFDAPLGSALRRCPDVEKMFAITGFRCRWTWQQGIKQLLEKTSA